MATGHAIFNDTETPLWFQIYIMGRIWSFLCFCTNHADVVVFLLSIARALAVILRQKVRKKRLGRRGEDDGRIVRIGSTDC